MPSATTSRMSSPPSRHYPRCCTAIIMVQGDIHDSNIMSETTPTSSDSDSDAAHNIKLTNVSLIHLHSSSSLQSESPSSTATTTKINGTTAIDGRQHSHNHPCLLVHHEAVDDSIIEIETVSYRTNNGKFGYEQEERRCSSSLSQIMNLFPTVTYCAIQDDDEPDDANDKELFSAECVEFLQEVISNYLHSKQIISYHPRKKIHMNGVPIISRTDVQRLCHSFVRWATTSKARYHDRRQPFRSLRQCICPCNHFNCIANTIVSELGLDDDGDVTNLLKFDTMRCQQQQKSKESASSVRSSWRLVLVDRISNPIKSGRNEILSTPIHDDNQRQELPPTFACCLLSKHTTQPLISITLCPSQSTAASSNAITTDALLRACVKRLLVGKIVLHSEFPMKSYGETTLLIRTRLIIRLPHSNPSQSLLVHQDDNHQLLEFRVINIQSTLGNKYDTIDDADDRDAKLPTQFVILPSTKITFQVCETEAQQQQQLAQSVTEDVSHRHLPETLISASLSATHKNIPHHHLLESLRSIMFFQSTKNNDGHGDTQLPFPRSFLFTGPPGVGKTYSVKKAISIANSWSLDKMRPKQKTMASCNPVRLISLRGSELIASSGGSYANAAREMRRQFDVARRVCNDESSQEGVKAVVVFLDECDALVSSSPIVAAMLAALLDKMEGDIDVTYGNSGWERIIVVAATNRVDAIPDFLRRPGRLEKEVVVSPPDTDERFELLESMLGSTGFDIARAIDNNSFVSIDKVGLQQVAEACVGYVAADLSALVRKAAMISMDKMFREKKESAGTSLLDYPSITIHDLFSAMNDVGASCLRDASLSAPPKTTWDDIAGDAGGAKRALREALEWPRIYKHAFKALGLSPPRGVLLHGPPGCAKTTLARAAAGAAGVAFLSLSPADVYASSYVGEAEAVVRRAFDLARSAAPCVLFFDELDSIIGGDNMERGGNHNSMSRGSSAEARVLSTFLNEMDGVDGSVEDGVLVLGATNRPRMLDAALLRPGRFDRVIYVPPPDQVGRKAILLMECKKWHSSLHAYSAHSHANETSFSDAILPNATEHSFNLDMLASDAISGSMTGAEIVGACKEAAVQVMQGLLERNTDLTTTFSTEKVEQLMETLLMTLKATLASKIPLLSNAAVLDEYTRFERDRKEK